MQPREIFRSFWNSTNRANGLMLDKEGHLYGCEQGTPDDEGGRRIVRYETDGSVAVICDHYEGKKFNSPNDLAIDEQGENLVHGSTLWRQPQ